VCFCLGPKAVVKFGYLAVFFAFIINSIGWFLTTAGSANALVMSMPVATVWIHNTLGVFLYTGLAFNPVNAASDLISGYMINYISNHFKTWAATFQQMTFKQLMTRKSIPPPSDLALNRM
jgi:hypothetical protein